MGSRAADLGHFKERCSRNTCRRDSCPISLWVGDLIEVVPLRKCFRDMLGDLPGSFCNVTHTTLVK